MKKVTLTLMAALLIAAFATSAFGFGRGPGYGPCARGDFKGQAGLNLTEDQAAKLKEMREAQWQEMKPLREQMFAKRDELRKLWLEPALDQEKILAAQKEMRLLRDQMQDKMTAHRLEAAKVLTPEQRQKIGTFDQGRRHGRGFGPMHGFGLGGPGGAGCYGAADFSKTK